jgi:hypothetical protein
LNLVGKDNGFTVDEIIVINLIDKTVYICKYFYNDSSRLYVERYKDDYSKAS